AHEAKGAGPGDFAAEDAGAHFVGKTLLADQRRGEVDFDVEVETSVGNKLAPALAFLDLDRLQNLDVAARSGKLADAGVVDQLDEGSRAAVHDRHFFAVDFDDAVID